MFLCQDIFLFLCFCRGEVEADSDLEGNNSLCEEPPRSKEEMEGNAKPKSSVPSRNRTPKRPDMPLYMPRAARERLNLQNPQRPSGDQEFPSPASSSCSCISSSSDSCSSSETTENTKSSFKRESLPSAADFTFDSSVLCSQEQKQNSVLRLQEGEPFVWDQTVACFTDMNLEGDVKEEEDPASVSCSAQTEDTSTDTDDLTEEVSLNLKIQIFN